MGGESGANAIHDVQSRVRIARQRQRRGRGRGDHASEVGGSASSGEHDGTDGSSDHSLGDRPLCSNKTQRSVCGTDADGDTADVGEPNVFESVGEYDGVPVKVTQKVVNAARQYLRYR